MINVYRNRFLPGLALILVKTVHSFDLRVEQLEIIVTKHIYSDKTSVLNDLFHA